MYPGESKSCTCTGSVDGRLSMFRMMSAAYSAHRKDTDPDAAIDADSYAIRFAVGTPAGHANPFGAVPVYPYWIALSSSYTWLVAFADQVIVAVTAGSRFAHVIIILPPCIGPRM